MTLLGGDYSSIRLDDADGVTIDGARVVMPATSATPRHTPAVLMYRAKDVVFRNFDISTTHQVGFRLGYGIRIDNRSGGGNVTIERGLIHNASSGVIASTVDGLVVSDVLTTLLSADGFFISNSKNVVLRRLTCGFYWGANQSIVHSDCIQFGETEGPTVNLVIDGVDILSGRSGFTQGVFAGSLKQAALLHGRHRNWDVRNIRGVADTWRGLSIHGVDGLTIDNVDVVTPAPPGIAEKGGEFRTFTDISDSSQVRLSNIRACSHLRERNTDLIETGQRIAGCRTGTGLGQFGEDAGALRAELDAVRAEAAASASRIDAVRAALAE